MEDFEGVVVVVVIVGFGQDGVVRRGDLSLLDGLDGRPLGCVGEAYLMRWWG
jgi:hypothetical protein